MWEMASTDLIMHKRDTHEPSPSLTSLTRQSPHAGTLLIYCSKSLCITLSQGCQNMQKEKWYLLLEGFPYISGHNNNNSNLHSMFYKAFKVTQ